MAVIGTPMSGLSGYQQMQVWSAKRASANDDYRSNMEQMTSALTGSSGALTGGFTSNEAWSSAIFGATSSALSDEETLMAQIIYKRVSAEQQAQAEKQSAQLGALSDLADMSDLSDLFA